MPTLRSSSKGLLDRKNQESEMKNVPEKEQDQWTMVVPDGMSGGTFATLPHPQNGASAMFFFHKEKVYELIKYKSDFGSWFIDETIMKDGTLYIVSCIDPLLLVLRFLMKSEKYVTLDSLFEDTSHAIGVRLLEKCLSSKSLQKICLMKGDEDYQAYKLDEEKLLNWLKCIVERLTTYFQSSNVALTLPGHAVSFVRNSAGHKNQDLCLTNAWMILSDYLSPQLASKLKFLMNVKDLQKPTKKEEQESKDDEPPAKRQKTELSSKQEQCVDDYRDKTQTTKSKTATTSKLSSKQKSLLKVDKKGMKTMSSFFKKTSK